MDIVYASNFFSGVGHIPVGVCSSLRVRKVHGAILILWVQDAWCFVSRDMYMQC